MQAFGGKAFCACLTLQKPCTRRWCLCICWLLHQPSQSPSVPLQFAAAGENATRPLSRQAKSSEGCGHCHAKGVKLLTCSHCTLAWYCSRECQQAAWKSHKLRWAPGCGAGGKAGGHAAGRKTQRGTTAVRARP